MTALPTTPIARRPMPHKPKILAYVDWADVTAQTDFVARATAIHDAFDWGCDEVFIRCYGGLVGTAIHFDAWWRNDLDKTNFLAALTPFTGKLILYGGSLHYLAGLPVMDAWRYMQHVQYAAEQLRAQMYFDNSADLDAGSVETQVLHHLKQIGVTVGVESWPVANSAVVNENWCITEAQRQLWQPQIEAGSTQFAWAQPLAQLPGRRISLFTSAPAGCDANNPVAWYRSCLPLAMAAGFDVACSIVEFKNNGMTRASLG